MRSSTIWKPIKSIRPVTSDQHTAEQIIAWGLGSLVQLLCTGARYLLLGGAFFAKCGSAREEPLLDEAQKKTDSCLFLFYIFRAVRAPFVCYNIDSSRDAPACLELGWASLRPSIYVHLGVGELGRSSFV